MSSFGGGSQHGGSQHGGSPVRNLTAWAESQQSTVCSPGMSEEVFMSGDRGRIVVFREKDGKFMKVNHVLRTTRRCGLWKQMRMTMETK